MSAHYRTLRYWLDVEALTYPDIPKPGKRRHYTLGHASPLPWQQSAAPVIEDHKYFVYFGLVQKSVLERELFELFRTSPESNPGGTHERKQTGRTFLARWRLALKAGRRSPLCNWRRLLLPSPARNLAASLMPPTFWCHSSSRSQTFSPIRLPARPTLRGSGK
jgi:hypothetical protein